jgi:hypothetical protein
VWFELDEVAGSAAEPSGFTGGRLSRDARIDPLKRTVADKKGTHVASRVAGGERLVDSGVHY